MAVSAERRPLTSATSPERPASYYVGAIIRYTLLTLFSLLVFAPFILSFLGTFKTNPELSSFPPTIFPKQWRFDNWVKVWNFALPTSEGQVRMLPRWLFNSAWLAVVNVLTQLFFCSLAAYAFARIRFPGRDLIFSAMIASMAIPGAIILLPGYVFYTRLGWVNTYWPLIVPTLAAPFGIFMLAQFFKSIPRELEEAAYIDGLGRFGTYWNIALPLSRPALLTLAIIQFQGSWNNFVGPLLYLQRPELMTLTAGMTFFRTQYEANLNAILVGAMFNAIPVLVLFFLFNRYFIESGSYSGLAGQ